jgi:ATP-binding cassette subfamily C (CFTR/MRP) protein 1
VLNDVSVSIQPGEKIAVCGPSGSGKTTLVLALLQLVDLNYGTIQIDGQDLGSLQPQDIASRLNVMPQEPFFIPDTLRLNLDPLQSSSGQKIEDALRAVGLWAYVVEIGGLDTEISVSAWSVGELQLLSLARSMVKHSSILILDEAMSRYSVVFSSCPYYPFSLLLYDFVLDEK